MTIEETKIANACLRYHNDILTEEKSLVNREELFRFVKRFYYERIRVELTNEEESVLQESLLNPKTVLLEVAYDGYLPHLGVVRMVLKTYHVSTLIPNSCTLYLIGNHYTVAMKRGSTLFGLPLRGHEPNAVKKPIYFPVRGKNKHTPLRGIEPPSNKLMDEIDANVRQWIYENIAYERKNGNRIICKEDIFNNLEEIINILKDCASKVTNYGDWVIRVQYVLFKKLLRDNINRILFLPMSDFYKLIGNDYRYILRKTKLLNKCKNEISKKQIYRGDVAYQKMEADEDTSPFWIYCPKCYSRGRSIALPDEKLYFRCKVCGFEVNDFLFNLWDKTMPDVVGFEIGVFRLGIGGWIVGGKQSYQDVVDATYKALYDIPPPPRFISDSIPIFRGIGEPNEGYSKTKLIRALIEVSGENLKKSLLKPWKEKIIIIRSEYLKQSRQNV